jgi:hypothetical protein
MDLAEKRAREQLWAASVERYHEQRRRENVAAWFTFFGRMADNHARLAEDYARRAMSLARVYVERCAPALAVKEVKSVPL